MANQRKTSMSRGRYLNRGRTPFAVGALVVVGVLLAQTTASAASTSTTSQPATTSSSADGWLALAAILVGVAVAISLTVVVYLDRKQSREKTVEALRLGVSSVTQSNTPLQANLAGGGGPADLTITADSDSTVVGSTITLTATNEAGDEVACTWTFDPTGVVAPSGTGPNANLVVTGTKAGTVTATASWADLAPGAVPPFQTGTKQLTVSTPKSSTVNFSVLGAGLGSALLALLAISGAIALAFRGDFSAEIGTLLGTALGAGAAGAVSAASNSSNSNSQPANPPQSGQG